jgi:hypothetical protein
MLAPPADRTAEPEVIFPLPWYEEFLQEIGRRGIEVLTYGDLFETSDDWDYRSNYKAEFRHWHKKVRDPKKTYLLIQHDVDDRTFFTERMIALEFLHGVRSNIFIFRNRFSTKDSDAHYPVDHAFLQQAERRGFVIGYHQNAFQLSGFDFDQAVERYRSDVEYLSTMFDIRFVVPHGGVGKEIDGRMRHNFDVPMPPELEGRLRWVFNRYGVTFSSRFSDGGIRRSRDLARLQRSDLIGGFLDTLKPGTRNFCLIHPQRWGYNVDMQRNPLLAELTWYQDVCRRFA